MERGTSPPIRLRSGWVARSQILGAVEGLEAQPGALAESPCRVNPALAQCATRLPLIQKEQTVDTNG